jgi:hypothetical protein
MRELHKKWVNLPENKRTARHISAITGLTIRLAREEYIPVLEELDIMAQEDKPIPPESAEKLKERIEAQAAAHNEMMQQKKIDGDRQDFKVVKKPKVKRERGKNEQA